MLNRIVMKRSVSLLLVLSLIFSTGIGTFANSDPLLFEQEILAGLESDPDDLLQESGTGEEEPVEGEEEPVEGEEEPVEGEEEPVEGEEKPVEGEEKPAEGEEKPAVDEEKPIVDEEKSVIDEELLLDEEMLLAEALLLEEELLAEPEGVTFTVVSETPYEEPPEPPYIEPIFTSDRDTEEVEWPVYPEEKVVYTSSAAVSFSFSRARMAATPELEILSAQVRYGGSTQVLYRPEVYLGNRSFKSKNGLTYTETATAYYTEKREISLSDPRIFRVETPMLTLAQLAELGIGDGSRGLTTTEETTLRDGIIFSYDGVNVTTAGTSGGWGTGTALRSSSLFGVSSRALVVAKVGDDPIGYIVQASITTNGISSGTNTSATPASNIPYAYYNSITQSAFGSGQQNDNRNWEGAGPNRKGTGLYELAASYPDPNQPGTNKKLAATDIHLGVHDGYHSWYEMNEFAQQLVIGLTGEPVDFGPIGGMGAEAAKGAKKPLGLVASGYIKDNGDGTYAPGVAGEDVYIEVTILGYGIFQNITQAGTNHHPYSEYGAMWNIAIAKDEATIYDYLKPGGTKDQMNANPQALINKYQNMNPDEIDMILPIYQNNVHSDEISGDASQIQMIKDLISGGKAGKPLDYKTFKDDQITWTYRTAGNTNTGYTAFNHVVKNVTSSAMGSTFNGTNTRTNESINTRDILDKFIMVHTLTSNPDGKALMRRTNRYNIDNNREAIFSNVPEAIALGKDIAKWDPLIFLEWHGYVSQFLIEPCTAPHSQNFEPDLTLNNMIRLAYDMTLAVTGHTGYNRTVIPWDHMANGWDDGGTVYGPMVAMLYGAMGWTIEFAHSNDDSKRGCDAVVYSTLNALLKGSTLEATNAAGNGLDSYSLNQGLTGTALTNANNINPNANAHLPNSVDRSDPSMRKSSILNKLTFKLRGVENIDAVDTVDKYFIDVVSGRKQFMGRSRKDDPANPGQKLSFFPDYMIFPATPETQSNIPETIKQLQKLQDFNVKLSRSTADVAYNGVTYPAGTYIVDMRQGNRNVVGELMGSGYDASNFASMYADIYVNYPVARGFDVVEAWGPGLFTGKSEPVTDLIRKGTVIAGEPSDYVAFQSNSTDAVRFVNLLLSGTSSGPSTISGGQAKPVWMLRKDVDGVGKVSDYIIEASSLTHLHDLVDNLDLTLNGVQITGQYIDKLPKEAVPLVNPIINMLVSTARTATAAGGSMGNSNWWALDDFLGFSSLRGYNGTTGATTIRSGANVLLVSGVSASNATYDNYVHANKAGIITVPFFSTGNVAVLGRFGFSAPTVSTGINDLAMYGRYGVHSSMITAHNEREATKSLAPNAWDDTAYLRGFRFTSMNTTLTNASKILFQIADNGSTERGIDANRSHVIGGFQSNSSSAVTNHNEGITMFSTILKSSTNGTIVGKPVQSTHFGTSIFYRTHYQRYYPMLATAIFAAAAGILDDQLDPEITAFTEEADDFTGFEVALTAAEPEGTRGSGLQKVVYAVWDGTDYVTADSADLTGVTMTGSYTFTPDDFGLTAFAEDVNYLYKAVITDWADNEAVVEDSFAYDYITVGPQVGLLTQGTAGSATFAISSDELPDGPITPANVNNVTGITFEDASLTGGEAIVTVKTTANTPSGSHPLTFTIDGVTQTVYLSVRSITIGQQTGTLKQYTAGSATFALSVDQLDDDPITLANTKGVAGITFGDAELVDGSAVITVYTTVATPSGSHPLSATIAGISKTFYLNVSPPDKVLTVGGQTGTLVRGTAGSATFAVSTQYVADGPIELTNTDSVIGITFDEVSLVNGIATITVRTTAATPSGSHPLLLTVDGVSQTFYLSVGSPDKRLTIGQQEGTLTQGIAGSATFAVLAEHITDGAIKLTNVGNVVGIAFDAATLAGGRATVTVRTTEATPSGSHALSLTVDGITQAFSLTIGSPVLLPVKRIAVGPQTGALRKGTAGSATFAVSVEAIADGPITFANTGDAKGITFDEASLVGGEATVTVRTTAATPSGKHALSLTIDGVTQTFTLAVSEPGKKSSNSSSSSTAKPVETPVGVDILSEEESSKIIQDVEATDETPVVVLDEKHSGVSLSGKALLSNAQSGKALEIAKDNISVAIVPQALVIVGVSDESSVTVQLTAAAVSEQTAESFEKIDPVNKDLAKTTYAVSLQLDDETVEKAELLFKLTVDIAEYAFSPEQAANVTGVYYDEAADSYKQLGGELSADGKTFTFYSPYSGVHAMIVSDHLTRVRFEVGRFEYAIDEAEMMNDVAPFISSSNRTLIPLRAVAEALGATVGWNAATKTATITKADVTITVTIGEALPNGMGTAEIIDDRTFVPVRYVADQLGANVVWDENQVIRIYQ